MGEYEPNDSRNITLSNDTAPGEPPRTGPREGETRAGGEKGERAAPRLHAAGEQLDDQPGQPVAPSQASQSLGLQGQSQSLGSMTQSMSGSGRAPGDQSGGSVESAGWAADFPSPQAEAASGHSSAPDDQHNDADADRTRREQTAAQGDQEDLKGFGYGAEDGEMKDAPDVSDPQDRGYGGAGEERLKKLQEDRRDG